MDAGIRIEPSPATLGATVRGVSLAALSEGEWAEIAAAFETFAVLVFPGQQLDRAAQVAFGRRFGEFDPLVAERGTVALSNVGPDGTVRSSNDPIAQVLRGNEGWHTDSSYMPVSAKASILSAEVVPRSGGETEWADMRAAYEALDERRREEIADLAAHHSLAYSQARAGLVSEASTSYDYGLDQEEAPLRPLVKRHPQTGRPALFIGRHAHAIPGLAPEASERLLDELLAFACQPPRVLTHQWSAGDVVVWDNRCVLHRARPYDPSEPRVMHHTRILGDPATESGLDRVQRTSSLSVQS